MKVYYRHGYSPDKLLGDSLQILTKVKISNSFDLFVDLPPSEGGRTYFASQFVENGSLILLCPENF